MTVEIIEMDNHEALAAALANRVAGDLRAALMARDRAMLAVPGGTTPRAFLTELGRQALDWENTGVTLTDERWVHTGSDRSNQRLLAETLFAGPAAAAEFVPLYGATDDPADSLADITTALDRNVLPLDVAVIGMGKDLHFASLFAGADRLGAGLDPEQTEPALAMRVPGQQDRRITLTLPVFLAAGAVHLLIHGAAKRDALEKAAQGGPVDRAPIRALLQRRAVTVFYAP